jgi:hypothetical protein
MSGWTADELNQFDDTDAMHIAGRRGDGSLRTPVIVWMVRLGEDLYTRSVNGSDAAWFRGTRHTREGHISVGGIDKDVTFVDVATDDPINADLDEAYGSKYRRYSGPVASITSSMARATTLKLVAK